MTQTESRLKGRRNEINETLILNYESVVTLILNYLHIINSLIFRILCVVLIFNF